MVDSPKSLTVPKLTTAPTIDANWEKSPWQSIVSNALSYYMGEKPEHLPNVEFKIAYDEENIFVIFKAKDKNVRAVAKEFHGAVWEDSCVEFFFAPASDASEGYFNVEINCGGTMLLNFQKEPRKNMICLPTEVCEKVEIAATHPKIVDPEIKEEHEWILEYRLPLSVLEGYRPIVKPESGVIWRANFYKCADMTSTPHWLTWSFINKPQPEFHVPEAFGVIEFA